MWQEPDWPVWRYDLAALAAPSIKVSHAQGRLKSPLGQRPPSPIATDSA
ncbi:MAG TPA: DUF4172 domain-containing protein [Zoogloea sp.]|nr:DUF4172 domain-containing protein [Zoogloea sp.]